MANVLKIEYYPMRQIYIYGGYIYDITDPVLCNCQLPPSGLSTNFRISKLRIALMIVPQLYTEFEYLPFYKP